MWVAGCGSDRCLCDSSFNEFNMVHVLILEQLLGPPQAARAPGAHGCYWSSDKSPGRRGSRRRLGVGVTALGPGVRWLLGHWVREG